MQVYLLLYVDDILIASESQYEIYKIMKLLSSEFEMKDLDCANKILGMKITRDRKMVVYSYRRSCTFRKS